MANAKNRGLKTRKAFSNSIKIDLDRAFNKIMKETNYQKSKLLDAGVYLLNEFYKEKGYVGIRDLIRKAEDFKLEEKNEDGKADT